MTNRLELEIAMKRAGLNQQELADAIGISKMALYNKINNVTEFKAGEIKSITAVLDLDNDHMHQIFFCEETGL